MSGREAGEASSGGALGRTDHTAGAAPAGTLIVSGTGTGVGKTVVTAAVAALAAAHGAGVAVVKPVQTGVRPGEPGDLDQIAALCGLADLHEISRFPEALSPEAAARVSGLPPADMGQIAGHVAKLAASRHLVLVEGAGGLAVRFDGRGSTIADLASTLAAPVLVVTTPGLGTLNHTSLTLDALASRGIGCAGVVIGAWPAQPDLAMRCNLTDLRVLAGGPLAGALPQGAGSLTAGEFAAAARRGLAPALGGTFDPAEFERRGGWPRSREGDT